MASSHSQPRYRIMILGNRGVGKRSLFHRIATGRFLDSGDMGFNAAENQELTRNVDNEEVSVILDVNESLPATARWGPDLPGNCIYPDQSGNREWNTVLLVFSCDDIHTLIDLQYSQNDIQRKSINRGDILWIMVANKKDLECKVPNEAIPEMATEMQIKEQNIYYVSALTGEGVEEMFKDVIRKTHKKALEHHHDKIILKEETKSSGESNKKCFYKKY